MWQKNHVFGEEIIQPLFDLADPNHPIQKEIGNQIAQKSSKSKNQQPQSTSQLSPQQHSPTYQDTPQTPQQQSVVPPQPLQNVSQAIVITSSGNSVRKSIICIN